MLDNTQEDDILNLLIQKFTSNNIEERQMADLKILQYELDPLFYISKLILLITNNHSLKIQSKVLITLNLNLSIKSALLDCKLPIESIKETTTILVNIFINSSIEEKVLVNLSSSLILLFKATDFPMQTMVKIATQFLEDIKGNKYGLNVYFGIILLFQSMIEEIILLQSQNYTMEGVPLLLETIIIAIHHMMNKVCISYENNINDVDITIFNANIIKSLFVFLNNFIIKKLKTHNKQIETNIDINMLPFYMMFIPFGMKILSLPFNNNLSLLSLPISWLEEKDESFDSAINYSKAKILQFIQLSIFVLPQEVKDENTISVYMGLSKLILSSFNYIINNKLSNLYALNSTLRDSKYSMIIIEMQKYLSLIYDKEPFKELLTIDISLIIKHCVFPLIIIPNKEIKMINEAPQEYFNYQINLMVSIRENSIRSIGLSLLSKFDGKKGMRIGEYIIQLFYYLFDENKYDSFQDKLIKYPLLSYNDPLISNQFILTEQLVELCLLLFIHFSRTYILNQQMRGFLRKFIDMHLISFISSGKDMIFPYIKHKLIMFLAKYCLGVYSELEHNYAFLMNYLWRNMLTTNKDDVISQKIAQDAILKILAIPNHNEYKQIFYKQIPEIVEAIDNESEMLFSILHEFIQLKMDLTFHYPTIFTKIMECLQLNLSWYYAKKQLKENNKPSDHSPVMINILLSTLKLIISKQFVLQFFDLMISYCTNIFSFIFSSNKRNYDKDIIKLVITVIKHSDKILSQFSAFFLQFYRLIDKEKALTFDLYQLINLFIVYDTETIETEEYILSLMKIHRKSLPKNNYNKSPILGSMLMGVLLCHSNCLPENIINDMIQLTFIQTNALYSEYISNINDLKSGNDIFVFISFLSMIYSSMINYPLKLIKLLKQENYRQLSMLIKWTEFFLLAHINSLYHNKIIILGICSIVSKESFDNQVNVFFLSATLNILVKQKEKEKEIQKKKTSFTDLLIEDDYYFEEEDDDNNKNSQDQSDNSSNNADEQWSDCVTNRKFEDHTFNKVKEVDEFKVFKEIITKIKEGNSELYSLFMNTYPSNEQQNVISDIILTTRVQINDPDTKTIPRRIVKVKKYN